MISLAEVTVAVQNARDAARKEARAVSPYVKSRGMFLSANNGEAVNAAECYTWDGTLKCLKMFLEYVEGRLYKEVTEICIEGGFDTSDNPEWLFDSSYDYDPWTSSWCVTVYKNGEWKIHK